MAKTPVCFLAGEVEVRDLPEYVYLWDKKKKRIKPEGAMEWMHRK